MSEAELKKTYQEYLGEEQRQGCHGEVVANKPIKIEQSKAGFLIRKYLLFDY